MEAGSDYSLSSDAAVRTDSRQAQGDPQRGDAPSTPPADDGGIAGSTSFTPTAAAVADAIAASTPASSESGSRAERTDPERHKVRSRWFGKRCLFVTVAVFVCMHDGMLGCLLIACGLAVFFGSLLLRLPARGRRILLPLAPMDYYQRNLLKERQVLQSFWDLASSLTLLGTILFLCVALRLAPAFSAYLHSGALEAELIDAFPSDVSFRVKDGTLALHPGDDVRFAIPRVLYDACSAPSDDLADIFRGVRDLNLLSAILRFVLDLLPTSDPYVRVKEFFPGENVDVRVDETLINCGAARWLTPPPVGGAWIPATVEELHSSTRLKSFQYTVRFGDAPDANEYCDNYSKLSASSAEEPSQYSACAENAAALRCKVSGQSLRRSAGEQVVVVSGDHDHDEEMKNEGAILRFEKSRFAILEGYSYHHQQHWQYASAKKKLFEALYSEAHELEAGSPRTAELWHKYTWNDLDSYAPLSCIIRLYCSEAERGELSCSRAIAKTNYREFLETWPSIGFLLRLQLHVPAALLCIWVCCVLGTLCCRMFAIVILYTPVAYIFCLLLRHVDTPLVPISRVLALTSYTALIPLFTRRISTLLWHCWGTDGHLNPVIHAVVQWESTHQSLIMFTWALWTGFLAIQIRSYDDVQDHLKRGSGGKPACSPNGCMPTTPAQASNVSIAGLQADVPSAVNTAGEASSSAGNVSASSIACRICYGGWESGRLISPCKCTGTMRFVHLECLNMWRLASSNPQSYYQCDQCQYRYSFKRALYANILRSEIVLNAMALLAFVLAVIMMSYATLLCDRHFLGGGMMDKLFDEQLITRVANETNTRVELLRDHMSNVASLSWGGMQIVHFASGLTLVGMTGFASMGFFVIPLLDGRNRFAEWPALVVLIGALRVIYGIYHVFKVSSGKLLQSAECMILDVGVGPVPVGPPAIANVEAADGSSSTTESAASGNADGAANVSDAAMPGDDGSARAALLVADDVDISAHDCFETQDAPSVARDGCEVGGHTDLRQRAVLEGLIARLNSDA